MASGQLSNVIRHLCGTTLLPDGGVLTDGQLLERFLSQRDEAAFAVLVRRHGPMVLGVCRRVLRNPADAEDAFQATFLVLVRKAAAIRRRELVGGWLHGAAYRAALEAKAARRRVLERQVSAMPEPEAPAADVWEDLRPLLDQELSRLPDKYRVPIVLCDLEGRTRREAARQLGIPEGTLSSRLATARRKLAGRLARHGLALSGGALAAVLSGSVASACVPTPLVAATVKAARAFAVGQPAAGVIAPGVAALTEGVLRTMLLTKLKIGTAVLFLAMTVSAGMLGAFSAAEATAPGKFSGLIRSGKSGPWSAPATWEGGKVPGAGARVQIRQGHTVTYDVAARAAVRSIHVGGTLTFARDRNTRLEVGLIKVQPGEDASEDGFTCDAHGPLTPTPRPVGAASRAAPVRLGSPDLPPAARGEGAERPALEVGTPNDPIPAKYTATIQLRYFEGMDRDSCPAIVCCGGRMDFHGAPLSRTWVKLGAGAKAGSSEVTLAEAVMGWRAGDRVILTSTAKQNLLKKADEFDKSDRGSTRDNTETEERFIKSVAGRKLTLDRPLAHDHQCDGAYRGEVANLSRNVVVQSAPAGPRGHTMYHRHSAGSISYAEFRHLGKEGVLGRYALHYHLVGDTMRGSSVLGASIWDSANRWLTIHGTNYLVVRDCIGYRSKGHGFFFEDGTEVFNVLDRNLAVQAYTAKPLPRQVIPFDQNDGSGFWWANSRNTFTRNVACECDEYGYFFQAAKTADFDPVLPVLQPDGSRKKVDIRTLPFIRFEDNEAHCQRRHAFNLGGGVPFGKPNVAGVGPDAQHPFIIRNMRIWNVRWAIHPVAPAVLLDNLDIHNADYGVWRPEYNRHAYRGLRFDNVPAKTHYSQVLVAPNNEADFPRPLDPVDDLPPVTVITHVRRAGGNLVVRGTTSDNGTVKRVSVNGQNARALAANHAQWEVVLKGVRPGKVRLVARGEDTAGNVEKLPHILVVPVAAVRR
jgi:RNA polymerase sigma factor (sigma-70 family)